MTKVYEKSIRLATSGRHPERQRTTKKLSRPVYFARLPVQAVAENQPANKNRNDHGAFQFCPARAWFHPALSGWLLC